MNFRLVGIVGLCLIAIPGFALTRADIKTLILNEYPGAKITEIEKEKYKGKKVYEVDFKHEGQKWEAIISLEGEIIKVQIDD